MAQKSSFLSGCLMVILLGGLMIWGIGTCIDRGYEASRSPEAVAARQQAATDSAVGAEARRQAERAEAEAEAVKWAADQRKQPERERLMQELVQAGVFRKIDFDKKGLKQATAWVDFTFYALDYDQKQSFVRVIAAYLQTAHRHELVSVYLKDAKSGHQVGKMGWPSYELVME